MKFLTLASRWQERMHQSPRQFSGTAKMQTNSFVPSSEACDEPFNLKKVAVLCVGRTAGEHKVLGGELMKCLTHGVVIGFAGADRRAQIRFLGAVLDSCTNAAIDRTGAFGGFDTLDSSVDIAGQFGARREVDNPQTTLGATDHDEQLFEIFGLALPHEDRDAEASLDEFLSRIGGDEGGRGHVAASDRGADVELHFRSRSLRHAGREARTSQDDHRSQTANAKSSAKHKNILAGE